MNSTIEVRGVSISFGDKPVLTDVSFRMGSGETLILLGVTGSGKSVLLKLIAGLLKPDAGEILIDGENTVPMSETQLNPFRKRMGVVFQEGAIFDSLSVYENVSYPLRESGQRDEEKIEADVRRVLGFVEMEDAIDKMPSELSGGMRRRVSIARAIVAQPAIMLYDSPTAGLDPVTANTINILIAKLRDLHGVSSVLVTQRVQDAFFLSNIAISPESRKVIPIDDGGDSRPATRFMVLRDKQVYFAGTREEFVGTRDPYLVKFIS
ncbi:MAG: ABC transporter ATP-binding protein [Terriglobia bacterium]